MARRREEWRSDLCRIRGRDGGRNPAEDTGSKENGGGEMERMREGEAGVGTE